MDKKIVKLSLGVVFIVSLVVIMGLAFAQDSTTASQSEHSKANSDGTYDHGSNHMANNYPEGHQGYAKHSAGYTGGHHTTTVANN